MKELRILAITAFLLLLIAGTTYSQPNNELLIDDFEGIISSQADGTINVGAGGGSLIEVSGSKGTKYHGQQALKIKFNAVNGGYTWVTRGYGLEGAGYWLVNPEYIDFKKYNVFAFCMHGANTNTKVAVDLVDAGFEYWRYMVVDDFSGWKEFVVPFSNFIPRNDWQPVKADKNWKLDFPVIAFQFEPLPIGQGVIYMDYVRLVSK